MDEAHEGVCDSQSCGLNMRWAIYTNGYFWPTMRQDCIEYAKGCAQCQRHGMVSRPLALELHLIIKPRSWALDIIGEVKPPSSKQPSYVLVATDYFIEWVEAKTYQNTNSRDINEFLQENIFARFGLLETLTVEPGSSTVKKGKSSWINLGLD